MASDKATEAAAKAIEGISWAKYPDTTEAAMVEGAGIDFARAALDTGGKLMVADELERQAKWFEDVSAKARYRYDYDRSDAYSEAADYLNRRAAELRAEVSDGQ